MGPESNAGAFAFDAAQAERIEQTYQTPDIVAQRARTLERLALRPGERVVDLGCGPGLLAVEMAAAVGPAGLVEGIDASPHMLALATRRCAALDHVHLQQGDVTATPFGDDEFDAAVSVQVYEFVPEVRLALGELARVLKPGGRAIVIDTDWESCVWHSSDDARMRRVLACWDGHCPHPHLPRRLAALAREAGLTVVSVGAIPIVNAAFDPRSYSAGAIDTIAAYVRRHLDKATIAAWVADLQTLAACGEYFFSLDRHVFELRR
jgi:arsenite methyltransferase